MAEDDTYARVLSLLAELSGETGLQPETRLKEDLGLDSIELVQLVMDLNRDFGITIHSAEIAPGHFATLASLAEFIDSKRSQNP